MYSASEFTFVAPTLVYVYISFLGNALVALDEERDIHSFFVPDWLSCCTSQLANIMMSSVRNLRRWTLGKRFCQAFYSNISLLHV